MRIPLVAVALIFVTSVCSFSIFPVASTQKCFSSREIGIPNMYQNVAMRLSMSAAAAPVKPPKSLKPQISEVANTSSPVGGKGYRRLSPTKEDLQILPDIWKYMAKQSPNQIAIVDALHGGETVIYTYSEMQDRIRYLAGAMQHLGVEPLDCISVFSENSNRWLTTEQGIMMTGACNAVRGVAAPIEELQYIFDDSQSIGLVVEKADLLKKLYFTGKGLSGKHGSPKFAVVLYAAGKNGSQIREELNLPTDMKILTFQEAIAMQYPYRHVEVSTDDPATLVYTSGTTSKPKGVVLKHSNILHQVVNNSFNRANGGKYDPWIGDTFVSILPCWHIFERTAEYYMLSRGVEMVYSNVRNFKSDLTKYKPHFLVAVPRLIETIYKGAMSNFSAQSPLKQKLVSFFTRVSTATMQARNILSGMVMADKKPSLVRKLAAAAVLVLLSPFHKIADKLVWSKVRGGMGGRVKVLVTGGSSLAMHLEEFFDMIGQRVIAGYGLTETSPVIANRLTEHNLRGSVGIPPPYTSIKLLHIETREPVKTGEIGVVYVKGPQVFTGYNRNEEATKAAIDNEQYFDTGDLGRINPATGDLILTGRAKDTIVLSNGENVEPEPLENDIVGGSKLVEQAMLLGQDEKFLGAIVVVCPSGLVSAGLLPSNEGKKLNALVGSTPLTGGVKGSPEEMKEAVSVIDTPKIKAAVLAELKNIARGRRGYETVQDIVLQVEPFTIVNGLMTQTLKVKRNEVTNRFKAEIKAMYR